VTGPLLSGRPSNRYTGSAELPLTFPLPWNQPGQQRRILRLQGFQLAGQPSRILAGLGGGLRGCVALGLREGPRDFNANYDGRPFQARQGFANRPDLNIHENQMVAVCVF
jgi:hypothetical protein